MKLINFYQYNITPPPHVFLTLPLQSNLNLVIINFIFNNLLHKDIKNIVYYIFLNNYLLLRKWLISKALIYYSKCILGLHKSNRLLDVWYGFVIHLIILEHGISNYYFKYKNNEYFLIFIFFLSSISTTFLYAAYCNIIYTITGILLFSFILLYIRVLNKNFRKTYPILFFYLNIICQVALLILSLLLIIHLYKVYITTRSAVKKSAMPGPNGRTPLPSSPTGGPGGNPRPPMGDPVGKPKSAKEIEDEKKAREKARKKAYRENHLDQIKAQQKAYRDSVEGKEARKKYLEDHKVRAQEMRKRWKQNNPDKVRQSYLKSQINKKAKERSKAQETS